MRGLYAAATVAPPARVESRNTLPPRSSRMKAVVASTGSSRSARAAIARVAAAASSAVTPASIGTNPCTPFAPMVFTTPATPAPERRDDAVTHRVEVGHQVPLGRARPVEQRLAEVGERHPVPHLVTAHLVIVPQPASGGLEQIPAVAVKILEHRDPAVRLQAR